MSNNEKYENIIKKIKKKNYTPENEKLFFNFLCRLCTYHNDNTKHTHTHHVLPFFTILTSLFLFFFTFTPTNSYDIKPVF